jgi:hypothetical protein
VNVKLHMYEVTIRRDVQQVAVVRVEANSRQTAIDVAESAVSGIDDAEWKIEEHIAAHKPLVKLVTQPAKKAGR